MGAHRKSEKIESSNFCCYGCGRIAKFISLSGSEMCEERSSKCPVIREKNRKAVKDSYDSGKRGSQKDLYQSLPDEIKEKMKWSKGLTKKDHPSLARPHSKGKRFGCSLNGFSSEVRQKMSIKRSEYLRKSENRKNLGRYKRSWMESEFEKYLLDNGICDWESEKHFWSEELKRNFYTDFIFESKKLIIELDGTQHRKTIDKDAERDLWFATIGYKVIRIPVDVFKKRFFSGFGFLDILGM